MKHHKAEQDVPDRNVEEIFELQPSLTIIKIDKQQRNDRGSNIRIKYISCSKLKSAANYMA